MRILNRWMHWSISHAGLRRLAAVIADHLNQSAQLCPIPCLAGPLPAGHPAGHPAGQGLIDASSDERTSLKRGILTKNMVQSTGADTSSAGGKTPSDASDSQADLLYRFAQSVGCSYLSDLRYMDQKEKMQKFCLFAAHAEAYPLESWNDAVQYLTGDTRRFDSVSDLKRYLAAFL